MFKQVCMVAVIATVMFGAGGVRAQQQQSYVPCADANGDCKTDIVDALYIAQATVGLRTLSCPGGPSTGPVLVDNGDGTVTDTVTGLMWEKKTTDGSLHDVTKTYTWSSSGTSFDGTAKTAFLDKLNDTAGGGAHCFARHCDWRLPSVGKDGGKAELETIVDTTQGYCGGKPFIDYSQGACVYPALGPTASTSYWSSTTYGFNPSGAWNVFFNSGFVDGYLKSNSTSVRAVRGGL